MLHFSKKIFVIKEYFRNQLEVVQVYTFNANDHHKRMELATTI